MSIDTPLQVEHQLDQLAGQFDHWRQTRAHASERIPQALWEQAVALTATVPPARVAKQLHLRLADLKHQMAHRQAAGPEVAPPALGFAEVPRTPAHPPSAPPTIQLELSRADGTRLAIHGAASTVPLATILRAFLEGR